LYVKQGFVAINAFVSMYSVTGAIYCKRYSHSRDIVQLGLNFKRRKVTK